MTTSKLENVNDCRDDLELVARAQAGNYEAFGALFERYVDRVYRYALSRIGDPQIASDVVQNTFLKAFESLSQCQSGSSFSAWLMTIATRLIIDHFRDQKRWEERLPDLVEKFVSYDSLFLHRDIEEAISAEQIIEQILAELNPKYRTIIQKRYLEGMSTGEVALDLYGSDTKENRRRVINSRYKALQAARKIADRITREPISVEIQNSFSDTHKR